MSVRGDSIIIYIPWSTVVVGLTTCRFSLVVMTSPTVQVPFLGTELAATPAEAATTRGRNWTRRRRLERARGRRRRGRMEQVGNEEEEGEMGKVIGIGIEIEPIIAEQQQQLLILMEAISRWPISAWQKSTYFIFVLFLLICLFNNFSCI